MHWAAIGLMGFGVYLAPPDQRGLVLTLAAGLWFLKHYDAGRG
jgi:hypothetical protein